MKKDMNISLKRGYTLLEIAVSLTIIGILVAIAAASVIPMATVRKLNEFKLASDRAMEWVDRFALQNRRLPNPDEFSAQFPSAAGNLVLEYHTNPNVDTFNLPEMYLGYRINHNDATNLIHARADNSTVKEDYAYYIDARFPDDPSAKNTYRQVKRYYPFLKLMGNGVQNNHVRIVTSALPKGRRLQRYDADILIAGGVTGPNATPSDCNLGRDLDIAIGIRAPSQWHHFFSSAYRGTWNTIGNVKNIFDAPEIFLQGTDCDSLCIDTRYCTTHPRTNCDPVTLRANKMPAASNWKKLTNCVDSEKPTDYIYKIKSVATDPDALPANPQLFFQGKIPPFARNFLFRYPYMDTDYPTAVSPTSFDYTYMGSHFYFVVFVRDNNNIGPDGNAVVVQKTLRVNLDPVKGIYPPR
jgi:prepilin-type N-terminal cleavage/methylation domain-containing protein